MTDLAITQQAEKILADTEILKKGLGRGYRRGWGGGSSGAIGNGHLSAPSDHFHYAWCQCSKWILEPVPAEQCTAPARCSGAKSRSETTGVIVSADRMIKQM